MKMSARRLTDATDDYCGAVSSYAVSIAPNSILYTSPLDGSVSAMSLRAVSQSAHDRKESYLLW